MLPSDKQLLITKVYVVLKFDAHLFLMPLAILSQSVEHQMVALLGEELWPVSNHRHPVGRVTQAQLASFLHKPEKQFCKKIKWVALVSHLNGRVSTW